MEKFSFFNDVDDDRTYFAEDFASFFVPFFTNGIFNNGCNVLADNNDMSVNVSTGLAHINGYRYDNDSIKKLVIENADGVLNRIDNIVIRWDLTNRTITAQVVKGEFAEEPVAPSVVRNSTIYDLRIAKISIPAGTTTITQDLVTDTRFINSDCGNVISPIETPDTEKLFIQIQAAFQKQLDEMNITIKQFKTDTSEILTNASTNISDKLTEFNRNYTTTMNGYDTTFQKKLTDYGLEFGSWFANVKNTLSADVAGALLTQINQTNDRIDALNIPTKTSDLTNDANFIDKSVTELDNFYDKEQVDAKVSAVYKYKGSVDTYEDLASKEEGAVKGDTYNVVDTGMNYSWTGDTWDALGSTIDLSDYATMEYVKQEISNSITKALEASY